MSDDRFRDPPHESQPPVWARRPYGEVTENEIRAFMAWYEREFGIKPPPEDMPPWKDGDR